MGKSVAKRKVRWKPLQLSEIIADPNHNTAEMIADNINGNHSTSRDYQHQNGYSHDETNGDKKLHFNEDEYTKITTPRQDVLLKKDYINRRKYLNNSNNGTTGLPLMNSGYNASVTTSDLDTVKQSLPATSTVEFIDPGMPTSATAACYDNGLNGTTEYDDGYSYYGPGIAATPAPAQGTYFDSNNGILYAATAPALCLISPFYNPAFIPTNLQTINAEQYNEAAGTLNGNGDYEEAKIVGQTDDECDVSSMSSATSAPIVTISENITAATVTTTVPKTETINDHSVLIGNTVFRVDAEEFIPQSMRNQQQHRHKSTSTETNFYEVSAPQPKSAQAATVSSPLVTNDKLNKKRQPQQQPITILQPSNRKPDATVTKPVTQPSVRKSQQTPVVLKSKEALIVEPKNVIVTSGAGCSKKPAASSDDWIVAVSSRKRRNLLAQQKSIEIEESAQVAIKKTEVFEIPPIEEPVIDEPQNKKTNKNTKKKQKKTTSKPAAAVIASTAITETIATKETIKTPVSPVQKSHDREPEQKPARNRPNVVNTPTNPPPPAPSSLSNTSMQQKDIKRKSKKKVPAAAINTQPQSNESSQITLVSDVATIGGEFDSRTNVEIGEEIEREIQRCLENEVECRLKSINLDLKDDDVVKVPTLKLPLKNLTHSSQFGMFGQTNSILAFPQLPSILTNKAVDISFKNNHNFKAPSANISNNDMGLPRQVLTTTSTTTSTVTKTEPTECMSKSTVVLANGSITQPSESESTTEATSSVKLNKISDGSDISSTVRNWFSNHHGVKALKTPQQLHMLRSRVQQQLCPELLTSQSAPRSTLKPTNSSGFLTAASHVACNIA